jgi:cytochrome c
VPRPLLAVVVAFAAVAGCRDTSVEKNAAAMTGGNVARGRAAIGKYGCAGCHTIPGVENAGATVGPTLERIASRPTLLRQVPNTPENIMKWLQHPQQIDPNSPMPDMGVTDTDARDIAAFLYTLR